MRIRRSNIYGASPPLFLSLSFFFFLFLFGGYVLEMRTRQEICDPTFEPRLRIKRLLLFYGTVLRGGEERRELVRGDGVNVALTTLPTPVPIPQRYGFSWTARKGRGGR